MGDNRRVESLDNLAAPAPLDGYEAAARQIPDISKAFIWHARLDPARAVAMIRRHDDAQLPSRVDGPNYRPGSLSREPGPTTRLRQTHFMIEPKP